jgi:hypothetical protein
MGINSLAVADARHSLNVRPTCKLPVVTEYFGSNYSSYSTTTADCKHSKDPVQFKLRSLDRTGYPSSMYSRSNDASF